MTEKKLWNISEIKETAASTEMIVLQDPYIVLVDIDFRNKRLWIQGKAGYEEIDVKRMVKDIASYLSKRVSLEALLKDKILHEPAETIIDLHKRVTNKGTVKEHKGCFSLSIKGKQGRPLEIEL